MAKNRDWLHMDNTYKRDDDAHNLDAKLGDAAAKLKALQHKIKSEVEQPRSCLSQGLREVREVLFGAKLNVLLLLVPLALISSAAKWPEPVTFLFALLPLCSLAERLGFVTEQLAMYTNETFGGLLNASFGNATEVIVAGFALSKGMVRLVQLSLLGSVTSNLLLVLGSAFLAGGLRWPMQQFNKKGANVHCGLLILGCVAVMLPSTLSETHTLSGDDVRTGRSAHAPRPSDKAEAHELALSRFEAVAMLMLYVAYLLFQLFTHRHLFEEEVPNAAPSHSSTSSSDFVKLVKKDMDHDAEQGKAVELFCQTTRMPAHSDAHSSAPATPNSARGLLDHGADQNAEEEDELVLSRWGSILWLSLVTLFIALMSEPLTDTIEKAANKLNIGEPFMYTIILPIAGNAAEHTSAVIFAVKNKMELSLGVAVGSATQVLVLVVPLCVVLGWVMGTPLDLDFNTFEGLTLFIGVLLAIIVVQDGYSHWLKGVVLVVTYLFTAAAFWNHYDERLDSKYNA